MALLPVMIFTNIAAAFVTLSCYCCYAVDDIVDMLIRYGCFAARGCCCRRRLLWRDTRVDIADYFRRHDAISQRNIVRTVTTVMAAALSPFRFRCLSPPRRRCCYAYFLLHYHFHYAFAFRRHDTLMLAFSSPAAADAADITLMLPPLDMMLHILSLHTIYGFTYGMSPT